MIYGTDYYPEHWPEDRWPEDLRLMKEANINTIRIAEFMWSAIEPSEGLYDFTLLDKIIGLAVSAGMDIVLCTPTAAPPKWLMDLHPEIYQKDSSGKARGFGSRRHYCFNSVVFKEYSREIIKEMATRYSGNENVIAWQLDNEFGCHDTVRCYCDSCSKAFSKWLESKYGRIAELNEKLGMAFWGQHYPSFESVVLPADTVCDNKAAGMHAHNPGLFLDYCRFASDSVYDYAIFQINELRKYGVNVPITHNFMGSFYDLDYYKLAKPFDFISWDCYPNIAHGPFSSLSEVSYNHDKMRGYRNDKYWVMEQCSGQNGWNYMHETPRPGEIRLWAYQSVAHGADGIVYFRWRPALFGTEQYWHGILDHDGIPRQRYDEIKQTGKEMKDIDEIIAGSRITSDVCILNSFDNTWSHAYQKHSENFDYNRILYTIHNSITSLNINCDVRTMCPDLFAYRLVIMPAYNISSEEDASLLASYVSDGGHLVITFRSGNRDLFNKINGLVLPGYFRELCGIDVINYDAAGTSIRPVSGITGRLNADTWCDIVNERDSTVLAEYTGGFYSGTPCITSNSFGKGKVYYIGINTDMASYSAIFDYISEKAGVQRTPLRPVPGVETVTRKSPGSEYIFVMNHNDTPAIVPLDRQYTDAISKDHLSDCLRLESFGVAVIY